MDFLNLSHGDVHEEIVSYVQGCTIKPSAILGLQNKQVSNVRVTWQNTLGMLGYMANNASDVAVTEHNVREVRGTRQQSQVCLDYAAYMAYTVYTVYTAYAAYRVNAV